MKPEAESLLRVSTAIATLAFELEDETIELSRILTSFISVQGHTNRAIAQITERRNKS